MRWLSYIFLALMSLGFLGVIAVLGLIGYAIGYYGRDLPDYEQLKDYKPAIVSRIYAGDGHLMAEYAQEKRVFIPAGAIPDIIKNAFISAEDKNFYSHRGVDIYAIARAMVTNLKNSGSGRRLIGASTITQQVAKNFLLTNEVSYQRKIREALLAWHMEKVLTKSQILELYLNEIYLGQRSYGIAAAALTYFDKPLDEITIPEAAYLASLPKAPNNYHPVKHHDRALARRNWVLDRMAEDGHITESQAQLAKTVPLEAVEKEDVKILSSGFFTEEVRRVLEKKYGADELYKGGLTVKTSVNPEYQKLATKALRHGLMAYDKRHGWRGPLKNVDISGNNWKEELGKISPPPEMLEEWKLAIVISTNKNTAKIGFKDGKTARMDLSGVEWARKCIGNCLKVGAAVTSVRQVLNTGDVIMVEKTDKGYTLQQIPGIQGAIIVLDPHTGRVLAMQGGWKYGASKFNRATQAWRQPGSAFKPFVYLPALDRGYTPSTLVLDAPFEVEQPSGEIWRPSNYSGRFFGPMTIRRGIEKSENLMTVRMADHIGMDTIVEYAKKFGIADNMKPLLSYSLGAGETTLIRLSAAYGMLANGGKKITPTFIDRIQDRDGNTIFTHDKRPCPNCGDLIRWDGQKVPTIPDNRERVEDEKTAYQMVSILEGVIQRGTGRRISKLGRPLAGKTGTTNESKDAWFIGFSPNLVVGVFTGFDEPGPLGDKETGSSVAAPIFMYFMKEALKDTPPIPFRIPPGIKQVRVNPETGRLARLGDKNVIWEAFVAGTEPDYDNDYMVEAQIISGGNRIDPYGQDVYNYDQFGYGAEYTTQYGYGNDYEIDTQQNNTYQNDTPYYYRQGGSRVQAGNNYQGMGYERGQGYNIYGRQATPPASQNGYARPKTTNNLSLGRRYQTQQYRQRPAGRNTDTIQPAPQQQPQRTPQTPLPSQPYHSRQEYGGDSSFSGTGGIY